MKSISPELIAIITVGLSLAGLMLNATHTIHDDIQTVQAEASAALQAHQANAAAALQAHQTNAAADRRALQDATTAFRNEMRRLSDSQSRLERPHEANRSSTTTPC